MGKGRANRAMATMEGIKEGLVKRRERVAIDDPTKKATKSAREEIS